MLPSRKGEIAKAVKAGGLVTRFGKVDDLKLIGEGGNGVVYAGTLRNHRVAVKLLADSSKEKLARFKAEYLNVRTLPAHPAIVRLLHYEELELAGMVPAIVMARYDGSMKKAQAASLAELERFFVFLVDVLGFLHRHGVVHRDLKPENVLVSQSGWTITDFGIASYNPEMFGLQEFRTDTEDRLGNRFSAPEQAQGAKPHATMDIFALGQLVQWFAVGSIHTGTSRQPLTSRFPDADALDFIVNRCLAQDPRLRFQSIAELREAYDAVVARQPLQDAWACLHRFGQVLAETFPKVTSGLASSIDAKVADRFLHALQRANQRPIAYWFDGDAESYVGEIRPLGDARWLLGNMEVSVDKVWANVDPALHGEFVLLRMQPQQRFGVYSSAGAYEEAGLVDGTTYITRQEYDNGWADIGGEVVSLRNRQVELRVRHIETRALFIATKYHDAAQPQNDQRTRSIVAGAVSRFLLDSELSRYADEVVAHIHPDVKDGL